MARKNFLKARAAFAYALALCAGLTGPLALGQNPPPPQQTRAAQEDVVRVDTELVQTDVAVFDKQGKFVEGLGREQFEVRVDGQVVPVAFLERVVAGSPLEEAARSARPASSRPATPTPTAARTRGRHVAFFLDDVHLSAGSVERTRKAIAQFVERGMSPADRVLVATATGQVGFLQQFTDHKGVLMRALSRITYRPYVIRDAESVPMTEYQALRIEQGDRDALNYYVSQLMREASVRLPGGVTIGPPMGGPAGQRPPPSRTTAGLTRDKAERMVRDRASFLLKQSAGITNATLSALESLIQSTARMPGRKLVFFFSDGFYLNDRDTGYGDRLKRMTDAAVRAGVVVYTLDARGIVAITDAGSNRADVDGQLARANVGELIASQDPLNALASDTGGRMFLNASLDDAVRNAVEETSNYYRIAWKPEAEDSRGGRFRRVEVKVVGRPDLTVRAARGYMAGGAKAEDEKASDKTDAKAGANDKGVAQPGEAELREALTSPFTKRSLSTVVSASFVDVPGSGPVLTSSVQVGTDALDYGADGKQAATVDVVGVVINDQGKQTANFKTRLSVAPVAAAATGEQPGVIYNHRAPLAPGLYQIRAAARDVRGGLVGSASQWVEIPDLSKRQLALSSIHMGGRAVAAAAAQGEKGAAAAPQVQFSVDRRFARSSRVDFLAFVYNAARAGGTGAVDLTAQVKVYRDGRAVVAAPPGKLAASDDPARIPYTGTLSLGRLPAGLYEIEIIVNDNASKSSASQRTAFEIVSGER